LVTLRVGLQNLANTLADVEQELTQPNNA